MFLPCQHSRAGSCFLLVSASFFFFFLATCLFLHTSRHLILTKLGHIDRYLNHYSRTNNVVFRGHNGVTGVKKVIFTKKASSTTKVITLKNHLGPFGVTGVKKVIFTKTSINLSMLHSMTKRLLHVHQLETLYLC